MVRLPFYLIALLAVSTSPATAADKLAFAPVPAWVVPVPVPSSVKGAADAPLQTLLLDEQLLFGKGKVTRFTRFAGRIQNSQGLSAGNISIPWRPAFDAVTIHSLHVVRDGKIIDVLGAGQTFNIMRREANLESAMLDGVLTANIQPEGLQVGDIIDLQVSTETVDTTLGERVEELTGTWNQDNIGRAHVSALWPTDVPMRLRFAGDLPKAKVAKRNGLNAIELQLDNLSPLIAPKAAPARYSIGRAIELSSFQSWADVAAAVAPLYERASAIPAKGPLRDEVERIRKSTADPVKRAEAAMSLVEERVRYVALNMGEAGVVPASAEETWARRFGDCKGKTALLLGMLREYGIEAIPILVNVGEGDGLSERLPMAALFNHVLVRAQIAGREYWLDGTRIGDSSLANLAVPDFGYSLEITPADGKLIHLNVAPLDHPSEEVEIRVDASAGIWAPAPADIEMIYRGDTARTLQAIISQLPEQLRDQHMRDMWKQKYDFIDVLSTSTVFDAVSGELRLGMKGSARMDWSTSYYETDGTGLGFKPDWARLAGPLHDAPVAVAYPWFSRVTETIILPPTFARPSQAIPDVNATLAGVQYSRRASYKDNVFSVTAEQRSLVPEVSYAKAISDEKAIRDLQDDILYLRVPDNYRATAGDLVAMLATKPTKASEFLNRGEALLEAGRFDEAIKDLEQATAIEPNNAMALADRGLALAWKADYPAAAKSLDAAAAIDPRNIVVQRARGLIAEQKGDDAGAIAAFTRALEFKPGDAFASGYRAMAFFRTGEEDRALSDSAVALKDTSNWGELRLLRANLYVHRGRPDLAQTEAEALLRMKASDGYPEVSAAAIYTRIGKKAEAAAAYERALAIKPTAFIYINRATQRPRKDVAGRTRDVEAALKLEPDNPDAIAQQASLLQDKGDWAGAAASLSKVVAKDPTLSWARIQRGIAFYKLGRTAEADKDFKAAIAAQPGADTWNSLCWAKATAGIALESAFEDCQNALKLSPDNRSYLDSRGLVQLRLGKLDAALADYDRALKPSPMPASLMGRALALAKKGDRTGAQAARAAAEKISPGVTERFAGFGLSF